MQHSFNETSSETLSYSTYYNSFCQIPNPYIFLYALFAALTHISFFKLSLFWVHNFFYFTLTVTAINKSFVFFFVIFPWLSSSSPSSSLSSSFPFTSSSFFSIFVFFYAFSGAFLYWTVCLSANQGSLTQLFDQIPTDLLLTPNR